VSHLFYNTHHIKGSYGSLKESFHNTRYSLLPKPGREEYFIALVYWLKYPLKALSEVCLFLLQIGTWNVFPSKSQMKTMMFMTCKSMESILCKLNPLKWLIEAYGSHWVCVYVENGKGEYFDSYGMSPHIVEPFISFLDRNCRSNWSYNRHELQSIDSTVCGHYCIWFLSERARGKTMSEIVSQFSNDTRSNDALVKESVELRYGGIAHSIINRASCIRVQCFMVRQRS
jgi:hypothetical protein